MSDALLDFLAALYIAFAAIDLFVDWRMVPAAREEPHIEALTVACIQGVTVTIGGVIGALLGINAVVLNLWDVRIIDSGLSLVMLAVALGAPSAGKLFSLRAFRRWAIVAREAARAVHTHKRGRERRPRAHRRSTDVLLPTVPQDEEAPTGIG